MRRSLCSHDEGNRKILVGHTMMLGNCCNCGGRSKHSKRNKALCIHVRNKDCIGRKMRRRKKNIQRCTERVVCSRRHFMRGGSEGDWYHRERGKKGNRSTRYKEGIWKWKKKKRRIEKKRKKLNGRSVKRREEKRREKPNKGKQNRSTKEKSRLSNGSKRESSASSKCPPLNFSAQCTSKYINAAKGPPQHFSLTTALTTKLHSFDCLY
jgi:hypothetical protein